MSEVIFERIHRPVVTVHDVSALYWPYMPTLQSSFRIRSGQQPC
jgi:hypothetical protein